jgi:uncharacterized protein with HEPN domain
MPMGVAGADTDGSGSDMKRDVLLYLSDIAENMREAERFIGPMTFEEFYEDRPDKKMF